MTSVNKKYVFALLHFKATGLLVPSARSRARTKVENRRYGFVRE
jgi:hypothetical protein